ncbi:MAG: hypothetical protein ACRC5W_06695, partial [Cetobacterium sp.]
MKRILIFFFLLTQLMFSSTYIPQNIKEDNVLRSYKDTQLVLGLVEDSNFDNESLNNIIEDMLKNYLGLNIKVVKKDYNKINSLYNEKKLDIVGLVFENSNFVELKNSKRIIDHSPGISIILKDSLIDLSLIINNALLQRYETIIKEASDKRESNIFKSNFLNSLTDFEKEYLKTLNLVEVGV